MIAAGLALVLASCGATGEGAGTTDTQAPDALDPSLGSPFAMAVQGRKSLWDGPFPSEELKADPRPWPNPDGNALVDQLLALTVQAPVVDREFAHAGAVFLPAGAAVDPKSLPTLAQSVNADAAVYLVDLGSGQRHPVQVSFLTDGGPLGTANLLALLPLQGVPLKPLTDYAAVITSKLAYTDGRHPAPSPTLAALVAGNSAHPYAQALAKYPDALASPDVVAFAYFRTGNAANDMRPVLEEARIQHPAVLPPTAPTLTDVFPTYCVFASTVQVPVYQHGSPPYAEVGGAWQRGADGHYLFDHAEAARIWFTVPRQSAPVSGFPTVYFIGTGAGGERGLVDRGVCSTEAFTVADVPGSGPALEFARVGWAGVQIDGTLLGIRNTTGGNEDFLLFNVFNPAALRDNIRQSALEIALLPEALGTYTFDTSSCPGAPATFQMHPQHLALMGHSMGSSIAPLVLAAQPKFQAAILSGAGGSYIDNVMDKLLPLPVKGVAAALLGYDIHGRELTRFDPALTLFQWAVELADSPPYGAMNGAHILMLQGIVDHYILPSIAQATSLSMGLDLVGVDLAAQHTELEAMQQPHLSQMLPLVGGKVLPFPVAGNGKDGRTRVVVHNPGDGMEDGHEVNFQTARPKSQYRCFLADLAAGKVPVVRDQGGGDVCW